MFRLDSLTLVPESVKLFVATADSIPQFQSIASSFFEIKQDSLWLKKAPDAPLVYVAYRVLPFDLGRSYSHFDSTQVKLEDLGGIAGYKYDPFLEESSILDFGKLDYNGSFSRGLAFGNNQNLVLNSNFNLQLAGDLGDDVQILAAITDENIPLQAEGNTQNLQEFDRLFIQLKRRNNQLTAGDYELTRPNSYFMNYYKKLQGATFSNTQKFKKAKLETEGSVAVARGKFARNLPVAIEGNQGPYKLRGNEGERFIVALAGTEKVFLDGELLERGIERDYVIDYNRAELTFTNKRLITKDRRIIIEFEYATQNYLTSLYAVSSEYQSDKWTLNFNIYSQQDSRNVIGDSLQLSDEQQNVLINAGDDPSLAVVSSVDTLEAFNALRVLYEYRDTTYIVNGVAQQAQILVYSTASDARLSARFSQVGFGNGNYIQSTTQVNANGRVYEWIAPDPISNEARGNYAPIIQLSTPERQQLYTLGASYALGKKGTINSEVSLSNNDENRFSSFDSADNIGLAAYTRLNQTFDLGKNKAWQLETDAAYEVVQQSFQALNPYRAAEFVRDWNINNNERRMEQVMRGALALSRQELGKMRYEFSRFLRAGLYQGSKHSADFSLEKNGWKADGRASFLSTSSTAERTTFLRPKVTLEKQFKKLNNWTIGLWAEREQNERFASESDSLSATSFQFDWYGATISSPKDKAFQSGVAYTQRYDYLPVQATFKATTLANDFNWNGQWKAKKASRLNWNLTYRQLQILDPNLINQAAQETYLGRVQHFLNIAKGTIRSNLTYELSSGQEPKIEYNYLRVNDGEGTYQWIDYNQDSVLQVNELEIANFQDNANYVRVSIYTDEFIRSNNVQLNESLNIDPRRIWGKEEGIRQLLSRFSTQSTVRILRRVRAVEGVSAWNPFQLGIVDTALVASNVSIRNTLFFNRANPKFDLQLGQQINQQKQVLTSGFESRATNEPFVRTRWNVNRTFSLQSYFAQGIRSSDSEFFNQRDYNIRYTRIEPQLTWLPSQQFRAILGFEYLDSQNTLGKERTQNQDLNLELTYNRGTKTAIRLRTSYVQVKFEGDADSPVGFAILNGLRDGQNYLWNLSIDRRLGENIRLNISYEGRKTGELRTVHVGRAQVSAIF